MSELPKRQEWMPEFLAPRSTGSVWLGYYETGLRAQIAVLEEMQSAGAQHYGGHPYTVEFEWIGRKLAALRKELSA